MKVIIFLFISLLLTGMAACKKEQYDLPVSLIKTVNNGTDVDTIFYDSLNRAIMINTKNEELVTFKYFNGDSVQERFFNSSGANFSTLIHKMNTFGLNASSRISVYSTNFYTYKFDAQNRLIFAETNFADFPANTIRMIRDSFYYTNNNITTQKTYTLVNGGRWDTVIYTNTYSDKTNTLTKKAFGQDFKALYGGLYSPLNLFGFEALNENLILTQKDETNNSTTEYTYDFDTENRVIRRVKTKDGTLSGTRLYSYY